MRTGIYGEQNLQEQDESSIIREVHFKTLEKETPDLTLAKDTATRPLTFVPNVSQQKYPKLAILQIIHVSNVSNVFLIQKLAFHLFQLMLANIFLLIYFFLRTTSSIKKNKKHHQTIVSQILVKHQISKQIQTKKLKSNLLYSIQPDQMFFLQLTKRLLLVTISLLYAHLEIIGMGKRYDKDKKLNRPFSNVKQ